MHTPEIPPRSWLFSVPLLGRGTGQVESLASFVARVAKEHFHRPSGLLHRGLEWHAVGKPENVGRWLRGAKQLRMGWAINGHRNAEKWIEVLEAQMLTSNLQEATISSWAHLFPKLRLLRRNHCWCPECHKEGNKYDRLMWSLAPVKVCSSHKVRLVQACPSCGSHFAPLEARSRPGTCPKCEAFLSDVLPLQLQPASTYELWVAHEMERFHVAMQEANAPKAPAPIPEVLEACMSATGIRNCSELGEKLGVSRITAWYWRAGAAKPDLENYLRVARAFGLSLNDVVLGRVPTSIVSIALEPKHQIPRRRARLFQTQTVLTSIASIRSDRLSNPPSLEEVAQYVGFSPRVIRKHFPELCREISQVHIASCRVKVAARQQALRLTLKEAYLRAKQDSPRPTRKQVSDHMPKPGVMRSAKARAILQQLELTLPDKIVNNPPQLHHFDRA
ncbi:MAG: TniQ family protein [Opitutaceae bacterium]|nr:TniQ family protein [Opitutaceae bacterium]